MLQVKIIQENELDSLNRSVNEFLATIHTDKPIDIKWELQDIPFIAIIQYEHKEPWMDEKCYDCKYWDDGGDSAAVSGLCRECGGRRRFNCKACSAFKDMRG